MGQGVRRQATAQGRGGHFGSDALCGGIDAGFDPGAASAGGFFESLAISAKLRVIKVSGMSRWSITRVYFQPARPATMVA